MLESMDSETLFLTITNIGLGVVTVICIAAVGMVIVKEVFSDARSTVKVPHLQDDHSFMLADLGITMADGGKRIDEQEVLQHAQKGEEKNIFRSEN